MLWGCIIVKSTRYACKIEGKIDFNIYKSILEDKLLETIKYYGLDKDNAIFQQENT